MDAARTSVEAAIDAPAATVATTADELRDVRANAIAQGATPSIPTLPRNTISNILRGRIEELTGMALLEQGKTAEAVAALKRAVSVMPERSVYWRTAQWRLGTALASGGQERDALAAYLKSYNPQSPDAARRAVIEALYTKVNGSLKGLDAQVGSAPPARAATTLEASSNERPNATATAPAPTETPAVAATPEPSPSSTPDAPVVNPSPTPEPGPSPTPEQPAASPSPETPAATPTPDTEPTPQPSPTETGANTGAPVEAKRTRERRGSGGCTLVLGTRTLELTHSGGSASVVVSLEGSTNLAGINAVTNDWSDIIVLREPQGSADTNSLKFTVTSTSKATGNFRINFKSPCGAQELIVTVK
jgi:hypothetical protein